MLRFFTSVYLLLWSQARADEACDVDDTKFVQVQRSMRSRTSANTPIGHGIATAFVDSVASLLHSSSQADQNQSALASGTPSAELQTRKEHGVTPDHLEQLSARLLSDSTDRVLDSLEAQGGGREIPPTPAGDPLAELAALQHQIYKVGRMSASMATGSTQNCRDHPFKDNFGFGCADYESNQWCDSGPSWVGEFGSEAEVDPATHQMPKTACCACDGGDRLHDLGSEELQPVPLETEDQGGDIPPPLAHEMEQGVATQKDLEHELRDTIHDTTRSAQQEYEDFVHRQEDERRRKLKDEQQAAQEAQEAQAIAGEFERQVAEQQERLQEAIHGLHRQEAATTTPSVHDAVEDALAVGSLPTRGCKPPVCRWQCESPSCDEVCTPVCEAPQCETRCPRLDESACHMDCSEPQCAVVCPEHLCPSGGCPICSTTCTEPQCRLKCAEPQPCNNVCESPKCHWDCRAPDVCPTPNCELKCEAPPSSCGTTLHAGLPPLSSGECSVKQFSAAQARAQLVGSGTMEVNVTHHGLPNHIVKRSTMKVVGL